MLTFCHHQNIYFVFNARVYTLFSVKSYCIAIYLNNIYLLRIYLYIKLIYWFWRTHDDKDKKKKNSIKNKCLEWLVGRSPRNFKLPKCSQAILAGITILSIFTTANIYTHSRNVRGFSCEFDTTFRLCIHTEIKAFDYIYGIWLYYSQLYCIIKKACIRRE